MSGTRHAHHLPLPGGLGTAREIGARGVRAVRGRCHRGREGRVVLVDGTLTPCWSYEERPELWNKKHKTTGFNAQLISLLDGTAAWVSGPLPGKTHDAKAFKETGAADILKEAGGGFGDGLPGHRPSHPEEEAERRRANLVRQGIQLPDLIVSRTGRASRRPLQKLEDAARTDYRRPYSTYHDAFDAARALFFFSIIWGFE